MIWQDLVLAALNTGLTIPAILIALNKRTRTPMKSSLLTSLCLYGMGGVLLTLGTFLFGSVCFISGSAWMFMFFKRRA